MKTTKKQAHLLYEIGHYLEPFEHLESDKSEMIKGFRNLSLEENIVTMQDYLTQTFDNIAIAIEEPNLCILLGKLYQSVDMKAVDKYRDGLLF